MLTDLEKLAYQAGGAGWRKMVDDMLKNGYAPPGYRLVPEDEKLAREKIRELLWLGDFNWPGRPPDVHSLLKFYLAMLDAAPEAPKKEEEEGK